MNKKITAVVTLAAFSQMACYNTYFIDKSELEKLESTVEPKEVVEVYGDCPAGGGAASRVMDRPMWAQAEGQDEAPQDESDLPPEIADEIADDSTSTQPEQGEGEDEKLPFEEAPAEPEASASATATTKPRPGCTRVEVSTANPLQIVTAGGERERVTPFNFIMNGGQLVSPEYDLLMSLDQVEGAEVSQFSTWKTVATIVGVSAVAVGTFVGISLLSEDSQGFTQ